MPKPSNAPNLLSLIDDPSYSDAQLGQIVRVLTAFGDEYSQEGFEAGFEAGALQGGADGFEEGYSEGYTHGEQDATVRRAYIGLWAADTPALDLGTTLRIISVATNEDLAQAQAEDYKAGKQGGQGSVFVLDFPLKRPV